MKTIIFKTKKREKSVFYIFVSIINTGLIKDSWLLIPASVFKLLPYFVLVKVYEENQVLQIRTWKERRSILITFSDNYGNSYLNTTQI